MRYRLVILIVSSQIFLTGCVGLAASFPSTTVVVNKTTTANPLAEEDYLPRLTRPGENVARNDKENTIIYSDGTYGCYQHMLVIPAFFGT